MEYKQKLPSVLHPTIFVILASFIIFLATNIKSFPNDPGVGWHLKTGELILESQIVPKVDPFLANTTNNIWISDQWLSDVILFFIYQKTSWLGLHIFLSTIFFITFFVVGFRFSSNFLKSSLFSALSIFICLNLATVQFILRPVVFGFLFFSIITYFCLEISKIDKIKKKFNKTYLFIIPLVFLLWANLHPSFFLGFTSLAVLAMTFAYQPIFLQMTQDEKSLCYNNFVVVSVILVLSILITLINPYGYNLHLSIFKLSNSSFFARLNEEWLGPDFNSGYPKLTLFTILFIIFVNLVNPERKSSNLYPNILLCIFSAFFLHSIRFLPFLSIVMIVPLSSALKDFFKLSIFKTDKVLKSVSAFLNYYDSKIPFVAIPNSLIVGFLLFSLCNNGYPSIKNSFLPSEQLYPYKLLEYINLNYSDAKIYTSPDLGGFITFKSKNNNKAIIDDRNTMLGEKPYKKFLKITRPTNKNWILLLKESKANLLITTKNTVFDFIVSREESIKNIFSDKNFCLYEIN